MGALSYKKRKHTRFRETIWDLSQNECCDDLWVIQMYNFCIFCIVEVTSPHCPTTFIKWPEHSSQKNWDLMWKYGNSLFSRFLCKKSTYDHINYFTPSPALFPPTPIFFLKIKIIYWRLRLHDWAHKLIQYIIKQYIKLTYDSCLGQKICTSRTFSFFALDCANNKKGHP